MGVLVYLPRPSTARSGSDMGRPGGPRSGITDISKGRARESRFADAPLRSREVTDINSERSPAYARKVFNKEPVPTPTPERARQMLHPNPKTRPSTVRSHEPPKFTYDDPHVEAARVEAEKHSSYPKARPTTGGPTLTRIK